jgi:hypothetical protein
MPANRYQRRKAARKGGAVGTVSHGAAGWLVATMLLVLVVAVGLSRTL